MMRRFVLLLLMLSMSLSRIQAQIESSGVAMRTLSNGVRLLVKPEAETQIVALTVMVKIPPARTEQEAAVAEIAARAMYGGSVSQSSSGLMRNIRQTGGKWEILKTSGYLGVSVTLPATQLGEALYLVSDAFKDAEFSAESLEQARQDVLRERKARSAEPFTALKQTVVKNFAPFAEPDEFFLKRVSSEQARAYAQAQFTPDRVVVAIVGKFNASQVLDAVNLRFGTMEARTVIAPKENNAARERNPNAALTPKLPAGRAGYALVATAAPDITHPNYPAFVVMQTVLGGGHSSRLWKRIRDDKGIGYAVGTVLDTEGAEPLIAYLQWDGTREFKTKEDRLMPLQLLNAEVDNLVIEPPTEAEVERARNVAIGKDALRHERARDRAFALAWYESVGLGWQFDATLAQKLAAVTRDDVLRVAKLYLPKRVTLIATPR